MERLQRLQLLAHADVFDRRVSHTINRERGATPGIAVHLGQHHAGNAERVVKTLRDPHRVLPGHAVGDE
jgi:hypothetical protein